MHAHEHIVQFYEDEDFLGATVSDFLATGLRNDEPVIVIATKPHREAFCRRLEEEGFDVRKARADGDFTLVDAHEALAMFMVEGTPDPERFNAEIGGLIAKRMNGRRLRAYGEMVDVLWRDGQRQAAILLEELWNELGRRYGFSLLCAYVMGSFYGGGQSEEIEQVRSAHSRVLPAREESSLRRRTHALEQEIGERRELEKALREALAARRRAEEDLSDFFDNAAEGFHWVGPDGTILRANRAELQLLGYTEDEYIGRPVADFYVDRQAIEDVLARLTRNETIANYEATLKAKDGSLRHVLIHANALFRDGKFIHTRCFTRDITEQKRLEATLANGVKQAAMAADVGAAFVKGGSLVEILTACCESVVHHLDATSSRIWTAEGPRKMLELQASAGTNGDADGIDVVATERRPHLGNDGVSAFAVYPLLVENRLIGVFAIRANHPLSEDMRNSLAAVSDTLAVGIERKRCEELAEHEARRAGQLHQVTTALAKALSPSDVAEAIVSSGSQALNAAAAVMYVLTNDRELDLLAHRGLTRLDHSMRLPLDAPLPLADAVREGRAIWFEDGDALLAEYPGLADDPTASRLGAVAALPLELHGDILGGVAFSFEQNASFDTAERVMFDSMMQQGAQALARAKSYQAERRAREERERLVVELSKTIRYSELFTGVLAHDLRNPLGAIMTAAQLALLRTDSEHVIKPLGRVLSSGERMTKMIDQLLDFTRLRVGGGITIDRRDGDLGEICTQVVSELEDAHPDWTMRVRINGTATGHWDTDRLLQVFSNLAGNAVHHGAPKGGLSIDIDGTDPDFVIASVHNDGAIPAEVLPSLFDPFRGTRYRGNGGTRGLGLGLFITKELVRAQGGTVDVTSSPEEGTTFVVRLPRRDTVRAA